MPRGPNFPGQTGVRSVAGVGSCHLVLDRSLPNPLTSGASLVRVRSWPGGPVPPPTTPLSVGILDHACPKRQIFRPAVRVLGRPRGRSCRQTVGREGRATVGDLGCDGGCHEQSLVPADGAGGRTTGWTTTVRAAGVSRPLGQPPRDVSDGAVDDGAAAVVVVLAFSVLMTALGF